MRIANVRVVPVSLGYANSIFVEVETDTGIVGVGETVLKRRDRTVIANLEEIADSYLIGKDALAVEQHFERLYRDSFWVGGPLHAAARSALDIALWDIRAQFYNAPLYEVLGGPTRASVPTYTHAELGSSPDEFAENALEIKQQGYLGAKAGLPLFDVMDRYSRGLADGALEERPADPSASLTETEYLPTIFFDLVGEYYRAAREAVGDDFELMIDCHGRFNLPNAVRLVETLEPFGLFFIEEPLPPESAREFQQLIARTRTPIALGERLVSSYDVRPYLELGAVGILQCDVVNCGGITGARKIAAMAEAYYVPYAPHNPNGPIATVAAVHLMKSISNALILERVGTAELDIRFSELVDHPAETVDGYTSVSSRPGLGVRLLGDAATRHPMETFDGTR